MTVAVVGGGFAGLAAAVELAAHGQTVTVLEAARQLGGRARSVDWHGIRIDNGQHLFIGAYRETLRLMRQVGSDDRLERRALQLCLPDFRLTLPRLPTPLHLAGGLLTARGLSLADKWSAAAFMQTLQRRHFRLPHDITAARLLAQHRQSTRLIDALWAPICVAALNTPLNRASAQVFCNVLRDSLAGDRSDSDLLFGRGDLDALFPAPAAAYIQRRGGSVRLCARVEAIVRQEGGYLLSGTDIRADHVILAVHPARLPALLARLPEMDYVSAQVGAYTWQPIHTAWLRFAQPVRLPYPMLALGGGQSPWVFDRNDLAPGLLSMVTSAEGPHLDLPDTALRDQYLTRLRALLGPLPDLLDWKTIVEKRATYACTPGLPRPEPATPLPGLYLAGDYTRGDYPATVEGAVRSGVECARLILAGE
ncbi:MAG: hydroxysqualene dehydroxylase HpnE [Thiobacillaceae bacterium]